jgi:hypothetical protein
MKNRYFSILIEECLQRLDQGESLPDLLADFPDQAQQLQPLLLVAMATRSFPLPSPRQTAQRLGRNQMLAEMNRLEIKKAFRKKAAIPQTSQLIGSLASALRAGGFNRLAYSYRLASVFLVLIMTGGFYTLNASASSQPGDFLYTLKLRLEGAGLVVSYAEESFLHPPQPWEFGQVFWALEGIPPFFTDQETGSTQADLDGGVDQETEKELKEAEKDAAQDLREIEKEIADAEKEADKDLKEIEKEISEADKEEDQESKEADKEEEQDLKEEEKESAEDDKEEDKEESEADKEEDKETKEADKETRKAEKDEAKREIDILKAKKNK